MAGTSDTLVIQEPALEDEKDSGKKKRFFKSFKQLFTRKKRTKSREDGGGGSESDAAQIKSKSHNNVYLLKPEDDVGTNSADTKNSQLSPSSNAALSLSHDSVFTPEKAREPTATIGELKSTAISMDRLHPPFGSELTNAIRRRRGDSLEEDEALPESPAQYPRSTLAVIENGLKNSAKKSQSYDSCQSERSLVSMDSLEAELEEDFFRDNWASSSSLSKRTASPDPASGGSDIDLDVITTRESSLNTAAARHKIAIKPKSQRPSSHIANRRRANSPRPVTAAVRIMPEVREEKMAAGKRLTTITPAGTGSNKDSTSADLEIKSSKVKFQEPVPDYDNEATKPNIDIIIADTSSISAAPKPMKSIIAQPKPAPPAKPTLQSPSATTKPNLQQSVPTVPAAADAKTGASAAAAPAEPFKNVVLRRALSPGGGDSGRADSNRDSEIRKDKKNDYDNVIPVTITNNKDGADKKSEHHANLVVSSDESLSTSAATKSQPTKSSKDVNIITAKKTETKMAAADSKQQAVTDVTSSSAAASATASASSSSGVVMRPKSNAAATRDPSKRKTVGSGSGSEPEMTSSNSSTFGELRLKRASLVEGSARDWENLDKPKPKPEVGSGGGVGALSPSSSGSDASPDNEFSAMFSKFQRRFSQKRDEHPEVKTVDISVDSGVSSAQNESETELKTSSSKTAPPSQKSEVTQKSSDNKTKNVVTSSNIDKTTNVKTVKIVTKSTPDKESSSSSPSEQSINKPSSLSNNSSASKTNVSKRSDVTSTTPTSSSTTSSTTAQTSVNQSAISGNKTTFSETKQTVTDQVQSDTAKPVAAITTHNTTHNTAALYSLRPSSGVTGNNRTKSVFISGSGNNNKQPSNQSVETTTSSTSTTSTTTNNSRPNTILIEKSTKDNNEKVIVDKVTSSSSSSPLNDDKLMNKDKLKSPGSELFTKKTLIIEEKSKAVSSAPVIGQSQASTAPATKSDDVTLLLNKPQSGGNVGSFIKNVNNKQQKDENTRPSDFTRSGSAFGSGSGGGVSGSVYKRASPQPKDRMRSQTLPDHASTTTETTTATPKDVLQQQKSDNTKKMTSSGGISGGGCGGGLVVTSATKQSAVSVSPNLPQRSRSMMKPAPAAAAAKKIEITELNSGDKNKNSVDAPAKADTTSTTGEGGGGSGGGNGAGGQPTWISLARRKTAPFHKSDSKQTTEAKPEVTEAPPVKVTKMTKDCEDDKTPSIQDLMKRFQKA